MAIGYIHDVEKIFSTPSLQATALLMVIGIGIT